MTIDSTQKILIDWILINLKGEEGFPIIPYFWIHHILKSPKITKSQLNSHKSPMFHSQINKATRF